MLAILESVEQITPIVSTFWFRTEKKLDYTAGQFIELTINHSEPDDRGQKRWFTVSSSPNDEYIAITTKHADRPSSFKTALFSLEPGDEVTISQAMGDFVLPKDKSIPLIYVVGGIGVTPVNSMLKWLNDVHQKRDITILYAARTERDLIFIDTLTNASKTQQYFISEPTAAWHLPAKPLTTHDILDVVKTTPKPLLYISGPEELVEVIVAELKENNIKDSRLVTDYFPGYGAL